jgi:hypothetical protein
MLYFLEHKESLSIPLDDIVINLTDDKVFIYKLDPRINMGTGYILTIFSG